jgi:hypothetical protein
MATNRKRDQADNLSLPERYFIDNHGDWSVEKLAKELGKPEKLVMAYCKAQMSRTKRLMHKPAEGVVGMTEGASMAGDEARLGKAKVTLEDINQAKENNDFELAQRLLVKYNEQEEKKKEKVKSKYSDMIHYIIPPD